MQEIGCQYLEVLSTETDYLSSVQWTLVDRLIPLETTSGA